MDVHNSKRRNYSKRKTTCTAEAKKTGRVKYYYKKNRYVLINEEVTLKPCAIKLYRCDQKQHIAPPKHKPQCLSNDSYIKSTESIINDVFQAFENIEVDNVNKPSIMPVSNELSKQSDKVTVMNTSFTFDNGSKPKIEKRVISIENSEVTKDCLKLDFDKSTFLDVESSDTTNGKNKKRKIVHMVNDKKKISQTPEELNKVAIGKLSSTSPCVMPVGNELTEHLDKEAVVNNTSLNISASGNVSKLEKRDILIKNSEGVKNWLKLDSDKSVFPGAESLDAANGKVKKRGVVHTVNDKAKTFQSPEDSNKVAVEELYSTSPRVMPFDNELSKNLDKDAVVNTISLTISASGNASKQKLEKIDVAIKHSEGVNDFLELGYDNFTSPALESFNNNALSISPCVMPVGNELSEHFDKEAVVNNTSLTFSPYDNASKHKPEKKDVSIENSEEVKNWLKLDSDQSVSSDAESLDVTNGKVKKREIVHTVNDETKLSQSAEDLNKVAVGELYSTSPLVMPFGNELSQHLDKDAVVNNTSVTISASGNASKQTLEKTDVAIKHSEGVNDYMELLSDKNTSMDVESFDTDSPSTSACVVPFVNESSEQLSKVALGNVSLSSALSNSEENVILEPVMDLYRHSATNYISLESSDDELMDHPSISYRQDSTKLFQNLQFKSPTNKNYIHSLYSNDVFVDLLFQFEINRILPKIFN